MYTQETTSSRKPSPAKKARVSGGAAVKSFKSTKNTKSTKSTKSATTVETRASKMKAAAKAGRKTTGLDDEHDDFSL